MANEVSAVLDVIERMVKRIDTIRGTTRGQPFAGIPQTPWAAIWLSGGDYELISYGGQEWDSHTCTIAIYWDMIHPERTEKALEQMVDRKVAKMVSDWDLGATVETSNPTGYTTEHVDIGGKPYRSLVFSFVFELATHDGTA